MKPKQMCSTDTLPQIASELLVEVVLLDPGHIQRPGQTKWGEKMNKMSLIRHDEYEEGHRYSLALSYNNIHKMSGGSGIVLYTHVFT